MNLIHSPPVPGFLHIHIEKTRPGDSVSLLQQDIVISVRSGIIIIHSSLIIEWESNKYQSRRYQ